MFQLLRRVSGSFLPRPDRPWRDDATSHAPTIGRKRRHSVTEQDGNGSASSTAKRTRNDHVEPDTECDAASGQEGPKGDAVPLVQGQDVKEVTKGVKEVDLKDRDTDDVPSMRPEGIPLPDSPSGSPERELELREPATEPEPAQSDEVEEANDPEHADDKDSVASSAPEDDAGEGLEPEPVTTSTVASADETAPVQEAAILHDIPEVEA